MDTMTFVIFHGAYGNANGNWFPYVKDELLKLKQNVVLEQFPVEDYDEVVKTGPGYVAKKQTLENWMKFFENKIKPQIDLKQRVCFIGHSLAPLFILHVLTKYKIQLDSAIFVEPFLTSLGLKNTWMFDLVNKTFYKDDFDFEALRKLMPVSYVVWSDNDQFVPRSNLLTVAEKLGSSTISVHNALHINAPLFTKQALVVELCKTRLDPGIYL